MTGPQAGALFAVLPQTTIGTFLATLLWCGCRPGEAAGLQWADIDFDQRSLLVRRALVRIKPTNEQRRQGTSWDLGSTKTGTDRVVPMPDPLLAMLRRHRADQAQTKLAAGREYEDSQLVFASDFGKPLHLELIAARHLTPLLRQASVYLAGESLLAVGKGSRAASHKAEVAARRAQEDRCGNATNFPTGIGLYSLRHRFGSRLASEGVPIKTIQELMGHSSPVTTLTSYIHSDADAGRKALDKMEAAMQFPAPKLGIA